MLFCCRWLVVQQLWRVQPQRQISQKSECAQTPKVQQAGDVLDLLPGTKLLCEDFRAEDPTSLNKDRSRCLIQEDQMDSRTQLIRCILMISWSFAAASYFYAMLYVFECFQSYWRFSFIPFIRVCFVVFAYFPSLFNKYFQHFYTFILFV